MATKSMAYDHAAYLGVLHVPLGTWATTGSPLPRFVAFTDMIVKSVTVQAITAGTGTALNPQNGIKQSGTGTSALTTTGTICTLTGTNLSVNGTCAVTLAQGDSFRVVGVGTDATGIYAGALEVVIVPGASVTV